MIVTSRRAIRTLFALAAVLALLSAGTTHSVLAADPPPDPLQGPFVDAGLVEPADEDASSDIPPRLLVARPADPAAPGSILLEMLGVDRAGWAVVDRLTVTTGLPARGPALLVPLNGRFAVIASDATAGQTFVGLIVPGPMAIRQIVAMFPPIDPISAGTADVDGDGSDELILVGAALPDGGGGCQGSPLVVMNGDTLVPRLHELVQGIGLDGGAIGRFESRGGDDLIAYVHDVCDPGAALPFARRVAVVDLATGDPEFLGEPPGGEFGSNRGPLVPLLVDLDGDGIDEPILRSNSSLVVVDPAQDWRAELIDADALPLAVVDRADRPRLVVEEPGVGDLPARIRLLAVGRVGGGGDIIQRGLTVVPAPTADPTASTPAGIDLATDPSAPTPSWVGDLTGSGCFVVLVPLATLQRCPDTPTVWTARSGPAWLQTVPLVAYGDRAARRLLVAAGVGWSTAQSGIATPAPAATYGARTGRWRTGPSAPFALAVVDPAALVDAGKVPVPAISVDPNVVDPAAPRLVVAGRTGDRILARIGPVLGPGPGEVGPLPAAGVRPSSDDLGEFLTTSPSERYGSIEFIPVPAQSAGGVDLGTATFALPSMEEFAPPAGPAASWMVNVVGLNAFGVASPLLAGRVELDLVGPSVTVEPPFLSLPWPLSGPIKGRTEPGTRLRLAQGSFVDADRDGSFELDAALAPWPQDLTIEALDPRGNETTVEVSVVGGVDYRQLPWQAMVIVGVLFGAGITSFGVPLRRRSMRGASTPADGQPVSSSVDGEIPAGVDGEAEIEDLPAGGPRSGS